MDIDLNLLQLMETIKTIGGFIGALATITALLSACSKKARTWFGKKVRAATGIETIQNDVATIKEAQTKINTHLQEHITSSNNRFANGENRISNNEDLMVSMLRDILTRVYHQNYQTKSLPPYGKQYVAHMYEDYKKRGGNSYVEKIYHEMMNWEERM